MFKFLSSKYMHMTDSCVVWYRKVPKFSDTRKLGCNLPKIQTKRQKLWVFCQIDANGKANSEDPDPRGAV